MWLSEISVKRPVLATVMSLMIVILGLVSFMSLSIREYPNIDAPKISISTSYRGASASIVESRITKVIEDGISGIEGIKSIKSESENGKSDITLEFDISRDIDDAANDVRDRVSRIFDILPADVDNPEISKSTADEDVILWLHLAGDGMSIMDLTEYAKIHVKDKFSAIDGVARVRIGGAQDKSMRVWLNRDELAARGLTPSDVESALRSENVELPAGSIESKNIDFTVRIMRDYKTVEDFKSMVIYRGEDTSLVRLGDVAEVEIAPVETRSYFAGNGVPMVSIGIVKQSTANTLDVVRDVKKKMEQVNDGLPANIRLHTAYDSSVFIESAIHEVYKTIFITSILVMLVMYFSLGTFTSVLVPSLTVPISLIGSFTVFYMLGYTINLLTLLALVLAIGLVVDDAIVVVENIYKKISQGKSGAEVVVSATKEVGFAVIATTIVLVSVFVPITFLEGQMGKLFTEFSVVLAASVLFSAFVALTLAPAICAKFARQNEAESGASVWVARKLSSLEEKYKSILGTVISRSNIAITLVVSLIALCALIVVIIPKEYAPREDRGTFILRLKTAEGSSYDKTMLSVKEVEKRLLPFTETGEFQRLLIKVPGSFSAGSSFNSARGTVVLRPWDERNKSIWYYTSQVRKLTSDLSDIRVNATVRQPFGSMDGEPVQFVIAGPTYDDLSKWRDVVLAKAAQNPGLVDVYHDYFETKPQIAIHINRDMAYDLGVTAQEINRALEVMLGGRSVTTFVDGGEEYDVILESQRDFKRTPTDINNIYVRSSKSEQLIPLANLVKISEFADSSVLNRYNRMRSVTITAGLAEGYSLGEALKYLDGVARDDLPDDASVGYKGESLTYKEGLSSVYGVFLLALVIVFLVLAAQFESFMLPVVVIVTAPLAISGALISLYFFGQSLNIYSEVGMIVLIGVAAKNGVLIVEFANQLRDAGGDARNAVIDASVRRLRPILMTSMTAVIGALPLILASGAGAESRMVLGIVMFFGLSIATFLTLFLVPTLYLRCMEKKTWGFASNYLDKEGERL